MDDCLSAVDTPSTARGTLPPLPALIASMFQPQIATLCTSAVTHLYRVDSAQSIIRVLHKGFQAQLPQALPQVLMQFLMPRPHGLQALLADQGKGFPSLHTCTAQTAISAALLNLYGQHLGR